MLGLDDQEEPFPKPSVFRRALAHVFAISTAISAIVACVVVIAALPDGAFSTGSIVGPVLVVLCSLALGWILGVFSVWPFAYGLLVVGLPHPKVGATVEVLCGPYRGRTGAVYETRVGQSGTEFRVELGKIAAQRYDDIFSFYEVVIRKGGQERFSLSIKEWAATIVFLLITLLYIWFVIMNVR